MLSYSNDVNLLTYVNIKKGTFIKVGLCATPCKISVSSAVKLTTEDTERITKLAEKFRECL